MEALSNALIVLIVLLVFVGIGRLIWRDLAVPLFGIGVLAALVPSAIRHEWRRYRNARSE